jgi:hypothetical protein
MDDIPLTVKDRPIYNPLSPEAEQEFLSKQAEFEAAYRRTGEPLVLWDAFRHVWWSRQTIPGWMVLPLGGALIEQRTDDAANRYRGRMRHVQRYIIVRNLRQTVDKRTGKKYTKDDALDAAVESLREQRAAASRGTIEDDYDKVRKDLERRGRESEFFYLVELVDEALRYRAPNPFAVPYHPVPPPARRRHRRD